MTEAPVTRGFLFADLRDYTAFVEHAGNAAAAELLARYRILVREQVGRYDGAEIKTEGDSFYIVFPSASRAVECGLAIIAAADAARDEPPGPLRIGIGVHAGETVETAEGYVGSAVNMAARVAATARPGEVLVTDTVRTLTRGSTPITFVERGTHRLKGIGEPVSLFAALPVGAIQPPAPRRIPRAASLVAAAATLLVGVAAFALISQGSFGSPEPSASASASDPAPTPIALPTVNPDVPFVPVELTPGQRYRVPFDPPVEFAVPRPDWALTFQAPDIFEISEFDGGTAIGYLSAARIQVVFDPPCADAPTQILDPTPQAFVEWLLANEHLQVTTPKPINIDGRVGLETEFAWLTGPGDECAPYESATEEQRLYLFPVGRTTFRLDPGERVHVFSVNVSGTALTFLVGTLDPAQFAAFLEDARSVISTITIVPN